MEEDRSEKIDKKNAPRVIGINDTKENNSNKDAVESELTKALDYINAGEKLRQDASESFADKVFREANIPLPNTEKADFMDLADFNQRKIYGIRNQTVNLKELLGLKDTTSFLNKAFQDNFTYKNVSFENPNDISLLFENTTVQDLLSDQQPINLFEHREDIENLNELKGTIDVLKKELEDLKEDNQEKAKKLIELANSLKKFLTLDKSIDLTNRVSEIGLNEIKKNSQLLERFNDESAQPCAVISVDIRKSTVLMKESKPKDFALFMSTLMKKFESIVKENFGVFDKFTGDGFLAFFPDFYSGENSVFFAMKVANECHTEFERIFEEFKPKFNVAIKERGLGIGIDYGEVSIMKICDKLTVIGPTVVYACRFNSGQRITYLNTPAMYRIKSIHSNKFNQKPVTEKIKNQDEAEVYIVDLDFEKFRLTPPIWFKESK